MPGLPESRRRPRAPGAAWRRPPRSGSRSSSVAPDRAYLAFDRLDAVYPKLGTPERFPELCRRLIAANAAGLARRGWRWRGTWPRTATPREALDLLFEALAHNPHALTIHQAIWEVLLRARPRSGARRALRRADRAVGLLPRSARLPALPLPQHRAALAVPALPRVEHVRRGADRAGEGRRGGRRAWRLRAGVDARVGQAPVDARRPGDRSRRTSPSVQTT